MKKFGDLTSMIVVQSCGPKLLAETSNLTAVRTMAIVQLKTYMKLIIRLVKGRGFVKTAGTSVDGAPGLPLVKGRRPWGLPPVRELGLALPLGIGP